ncbi:MAG: hypothetical protein GYA36_18055 [Veillonellaceae bacterium]|nr:hypothetical protein [Veillonellaceae bacterium]
MIYSSAQGFETPLAFLYVSILVYLNCKGLSGRAVGAAGTAYIVRYVQPAVPVLVLRAGEVIWRIGMWSGRAAQRFVQGLQRFRRSAGYALLAPLILLAVPWHVRDSVLARHFEFDLEVLLLEDLASAMEALPAEPDEAILMYEIQGQFSLSLPRISMDGIVGGRRSTS